MADTFTINFRKTLLFALVFVVIPKFCPAQTQQIDSLSALLSTFRKDDTAKVKLLIELTRAYWFVDPKKAAGLAEESLSISEKINYPRGIAYSLYQLGTLKNVLSENDGGLELLEISFEKMVELGDSSGMYNVYGNMGNIYYVRGDYPKAMSHYQKLLEFAKHEQTPDRFGITYNNIGMVYQSVGNYTEALSNYMLALKYKKEAGQLTNLSSTYLNIGILHTNLDQNEEARSWFKKSMESNLEFDNLAGLAEDHMHFGMLTLESGQFDDALFSFTKAHDLFSQLDNPHGISRVLIQMGKIHLLPERQSFAKAMSFFDQSLSLATAINNPAEIAEAHTYLARVSLLKNQPRAAISQAMSSLDIYMDQGAKKKISETAKFLHNAFLETGDTRNALKYLTLHQTYYDSVISEMNFKKLADISASNEIDQLSDKNRLLEKENELQESILEKQKAEISYQRKSLTLAVLFVLLFAIGSLAIYRLFRAKNKAFMALEELNKAVTRQKNEIKEMNATLETRVEERTREIQNKNSKLEHYAFSVSHNVRAPLTNIMSCVTLLNTSKSDATERERIQKTLTQSAEELDGILRSISDGLGETER